ncbi:hypothetical protein MAR_019754 [Mya arenaria]|uniref:Ig-like domain-containing protein n=1 Tax=Mya arenaria TaxID=6604 RepID=A0ABY7E304_MYAAR|nr:hypothetical protein MAR_019754 [Mya arenaria]
MTTRRQVSSTTVLKFRTAHRYDADSPDVLISESSASLHENTPLDLLCKAAGIPAVYKFTGFLQRVNDIVVPNSHVGSLGERDSISVNIPSLQLQDTGVYTCYVHNGIIGHNKQLIQTASRKVEVQASPRFLLEETSFAGETSGNITIAIPFVSIPEYTSYRIYSARLLAFNFIGAADPVGFKEQFEIKELNEEKQTSTPWAMIGGTAGGGICVIVLVIVVVFVFLRKRITQKGHDNSELTNEHRENSISGNWRIYLTVHNRTMTSLFPLDIPDEVENPMYVSGDDVDIPKVISADIYATPDKKKPKQNEDAGDIYAVVDKKKKTKNKGKITGIYGNIDNIQMTKQNNCAGDKSQKK